MFIRKPEKGDANDLFKNYTQDSDVTRYLGWKPHKRISQTEDWIKHCISIWDPRKNLSYVIYHKKDRQVIGMIDPTN